MSIVTEISRIKTAANTIKSKLQELGLATASDTIDIYAEKVNGVQKNPIISNAITNPSGSVSIPEGYYDGTSSVNANVPVNYYITGSSTPSSSIGDDGDLYLVI